MTEKNGPKNDDQVQFDHPDRREINDWFLYGPKNGEIEELMRELTLVRGMRLAEVEDLIATALKEARQYCICQETQP